MNQVKHLDPAQVEIVQSRAAIDWETVEDYAQEMRDGAAFPAIEVFHDGAKHWCWDGCHRIHAARQAEKPSIVALVVSGARRDAVLAAAGANPHHGLRRKPEDKRRSVRMLLEDEEWSQWTDREIARRCNVSHPFVSKIRQELSGNVSRYEDEPLTGDGAGENVTVEIDSERKVERGGTVYTMNTAPISDANRERAQEIRRGSFDPSAPRTARIEDAIVHLPAAARPLARTVLARYGTNYGDDRLNLVLQELHTGRYDSVQKAIIAATQHALAVDHRSHYEQPAEQMTQVIHSATEPHQIDAAAIQADVLEHAQKLAGREQRHRQTAPRPPAQMQSNPGRYAGRTPPLNLGTGGGPIGVDDDDDADPKDVRAQTYAMSRALIEGNPVAWKILVGRIGIDVAEGDQPLDKLVAIAAHFALFGIRSATKRQVRQVAGELQEMGFYASRGR